MRLNNNTLHYLGVLTFLLIALVSNGPTLAAQTVSTTFEHPNAFTRTGQLSPGANPIVMEVPLLTEGNGIDSLLDIVSVVPGVQVTLIRPDGTVVTASNAAALQITWSLVGTDVDPLGQRVRIGIPAQGSSGLWRVQVSPGTISEPTTLVLTAFVGGRASASVVATRGRYFAGDQAALAVAVRASGSPVLGATVSATTVIEGPAPASVVNIRVESSVQMPDGRQRLTVRGALRNNGSARLRFVRAMPQAATSSIVSIEGMFYAPVVAASTVQDSLESVTIVMNAGSVFVPAQIRWKTIGSATGPSLTLRDDGINGDVTAGDGTYSVVFPVSQANVGKWTILTTASGFMVDGLPMERSGSAELVVTESAGSLGSCTASLIDSDSSTKFDRLAVSCPIAAGRSGSYSLSFVANLPNGMALTGASDWAPLPGSGVVSASVDIGYRGDFSGAIGISNIQVRYSDGFDSDDLRVPQGSFQGPTVSASQIDQYSVRVTGTGSFVPVTLGGGGWFDVLRFTFGVTGVVGECFYRATLRGSDDVEIDSAGKEEDFPVPVSSLTLDFDGGRIAASGKNGPYKVTNIGVACSDGTAIGETPITGGAGLLASQFRSILPDFTLTADPGDVTTAPGTTQQVRLNVTPTSTFVGPVSFSVSGAPAGITTRLAASDLPEASPNIISVAVSSGVAPGVYPVSVRAIGGGIQRSITIRVEVPPPGGGPVVRVTPSAVAIQGGQTAQFSAALQGISGDVNWAVSPSGLGSISNTGLYSAPSQVSTLQNLTVTATSVANPAISGTATVTLQPGWTLVHVGSSTSPPNSGQVSNGVYSVSGQLGSLQNNGTSDSHPFLSIPATGDVTIVARMTGATPASSGAYRQGILIRESTAANAPYAFVGFQPYFPEFVYQRRLTVGGNSQSTTGGRVVSTPHWMRISRTGNSFSAFTSVNGVTWTQLGPAVTIPMASSVLAGMTANGGPNGGTATATFDNVLVSSSPDYYLTAAPLNSSSSSAGTTISFDVGLSAVNGFTGSTVLSVSGLPPRSTAVFTPSTILPGELSTLTITTPLGTAPGTYPFTIMGTASGLNRSIAASLVVTNTTGQVLPLGWSATTIGSSFAGNGTTFANGTFQVSGTGPGMHQASATDGFHFAYRRLTGNGSVTVRMASLQNLRGWTTAGVMFRAGLNPQSAYVFTGLAARWGGPLGWYLSARAETGNNSASAFPPVADPRTFPFWVKLVRVGNTFTAYNSLNGVDWRPVDQPRTIDMGSTLFVGLAVSSSDGSQVTTVAYDNVEVRESVDPDFSIGVSPASQAVVQGQGVAYTVSINGLDGFAAATGLTANGLPPGVTATFSPPSVTGTGTSQMLLSAANNAPLGSSSVEIRGTSGNVVRTVTVDLVVNAPPPTNPPPPAPGAISVTPSSGSGTSQTFSFVANHPLGFQNIGSLQVIFNQTLSGNGGCLLWINRADAIAYLKDDAGDLFVDSGTFGSPVVLENGKCSVNLANATILGQGQDVTVSLPMTFKPSFAGTQNAYLLVDDAIGGLSSNWQSLGTWTVPGGSVSDFSLSVNPASKFTAPGTSTTFDMVVTPIGTFSGTVTYAVIGGLTSGITASFAGNVLTLTVPSTVPVGAYTVTIEGTSGTLSHTASLTLNVSTTANFTVSATPTGQTISQTGSGTFSISVVGSGGFNGQVSFAANLLPSTVTSRFSPATVTGSGSTVLTVTGSLPTAPGTYPFNVVATSGSLTKTIPLTLVVAPTGGEFSLSLSSDTQSVNTGGSNSVTATITPIGGFTRPVTLATSGAPSGVTVVLSPEVISTGAGTSTMTIAAAPQSVPGTYVLTLTATSGVIVKRSSLSLTVNGPSGDFVLGTPPEPIDLVQGTSGGADVAVTARNGFRGVVNFGLAGLPDGATHEYSPAAVINSGVSRLTLNAPATTPTGSYALTVTGTSGILSATAPVSLVVLPPGGQSPTVEGISPSGGSSADQIFTITASDAGGATNINGLQFLVNQTFDGTGACYIYFDRASSVVYLRDDANPSWADSAALGASDIVENSQCRIDTQSSSSSVSGNVLTLNLRILFKSTFAGDKNMWLLADSSALNSGWQPAGTWTVPSGIGGLPAGWTNSVVGPPVSGSGVIFTNGIYSITGGGREVNSEDTYQFVNRPLVGDGTIVARVAWVTNRLANSMYGVMIREGLSSRAPYVFVGVRGTLADYYYRGTTGATSVRVSGATVGFPQWVRLTRAGNTITGAVSVDGITWTTISSQTINLTTSAIVGLAVTSQDSVQLTTGHFDNISVTRAGAPIGAPDFSIAAGTLSISIDAGGNVTIPLSIIGSGGFGGNVALSVSGLPSGVTPLFSPTSVSGSGTSSLRISADASVRAGSYNLTIAGTWGAVTRTATVTLTVNAASGVVAVRVSPRVATLTAGETLQLAAAVTGTLNQAVNWSISPANVGAISASGLYTAPTTVAAATSVTITATSVADPTKADISRISLSPPTAFSPIRVNAGGPSFTEGPGKVWAADSGFIGGTSSSTGTAITGTTTPTLYQTWRTHVNPFEYRSSVPNGWYSVRLKFSENTVTAPGRRVFHVLINGTRVLENFDVFYEAGAQFRAVDRVFSTQVTGGQVVVQFLPVTNSAFVNAIEIQSGGFVVAPGQATVGPGQTFAFSATLNGFAGLGVNWTLAPAGVGTISPTGLYTAPPTVTTNQVLTVTATSVADPTRSESAILTVIPSVNPLRINAGGPNYTDPTSLLWSADFGSVNGATGSTGSSIAGTTTVPLYQTHRTSSNGWLRYRYAVPNGTYSVTLKFAEPSFSAGGRRFEIRLNGILAETNFDIAALAPGTLRALDRTYAVNVVDGQILIDLVAITSNPALINAIQIQ